MIKFKKEKFVEKINRLLIKASYDDVEYFNSISRVIETNDSSLLMHKTLLSKKKFKGCKKLALKYYKLLVKDNLKSVAEIDCTLKMISRINVLIKLQMDYGD